MTKTRLAKLMISCWDFTTEKEFTDLIAFLTVCMYHTNNTQMASYMQDVIWYLEDKKRNFNARLIIRPIYDEE